MTTEGPCGGAALPAEDRGGTCEPLAAVTADLGSDPLVLFGIGCGDGVAVPCGSLGRNLAGTRPQIAPGEFFQRATIVGNCL
jgi:hypothetical protein